MTTSSRKASQTRANVLEPDSGTAASNECDTLADACCLGTNFTMLQHTNRTADVHACDKSHKPIEDVPIVSGATACNDPSSGNAHMLVVNEALHCGRKLDHSLINPNQVRHCGIPMWDDPWDKERGLRIDVNDELAIPMTTAGTRVLFKTRAPSQIELATCQHLCLTNPRPWNPNEVKLGQTTMSDRQEAPFCRSRTVSRLFATSRCEHVDPGADDAMLHTIEPSLVDLKSQSVQQVNGDMRPHDLEDVPAKRTHVSDERHAKLAADVLADRFDIGPKRAQATLRAATQRGMRSAILPISRRYRADGRHDLKRSNGKFATDTLWSKKKSLNSNVASQLCTHKCGFNVPCHLQKVNGDTVGQSLTDFVHDHGAPAHLTFDGASVQVGSRTKFMSEIRRAEIKYHVSAPRRPNENPSEGATREAKKKWHRVQQKKKAPDRVWDFGVSWVSEIGNVTVSSSRCANGRTPLEIITGETPDMSECLDFGFYDWVVFRSNAGVGPAETGRWLGVSHQVGQQISCWMLPISGMPVSCVTVQRLTCLEQQTEEWKKQMKEHDDQIEQRMSIASSQVEPNSNISRPSTILSLEEEDDEFIEEHRRVIDSHLVPHADDDETGKTDPCLQMNLGLPRGDESQAMNAAVKRRMTDDEGNPIGRAHDNPLLDTRQHEVEHLDGETEMLTANIIAENLLSQVDEEGHRQMMTDEIMDHRVADDAVSKSDGHVPTPSGMRRKVKTTKGWESCVQWKDGSHDWVSLEDLKDSYPVQLADHAINDKIEDEPAFAWWVPHVVKKRKAMISKLKSKHWQQTHKHGIRVPKTVEEALRIDKENGNALWGDAIKLEMKNARVAFEACDGDVADLKGCKEITGHSVFDIKLGENFRRKARHCADGHKTDAPASVTCSSVVSRDSVRIILTLAASNGLSVLGADVQNAFLTAPVKEKVWIRAGTEFGADQGKVLIVVRALCGLKSASASFRACMAEKLDELGFKSSAADPDVWLLPASKEDGEAFCEHVMMHVDDILAVALDPKSVMTGINRSFKFKNDKVEEPSSYLRARLEKKTLNGHECWTIASLDCAKAAVAAIEEAIKGKRWKLPSRVKTPMTSSYHPELDGGPELDADGLQFFQEMIGMLRWATELGRVDVLLETSLLSQHQASAREGHLEEALHVFAFLKKKPKLAIGLSPQLPNMQCDAFKAKREDFYEHCRYAEEALPHQQPEPRGRSVTMTAFVDASHAANWKTRRSHAGFLIFTNRAPMLWCSKRQQTVESSTFTSEFIALKVCTETTECLRFKLRMFGVPMPRGKPAHVFCDNESVVNSSTRIESVLQKKHASTACHCVRWAVAAAAITVAWIASGENHADAFAKRLTEQSRDHLFGGWTY